MLLALAAAPLAAAERPRIFVTESHPVQITGDALTVSGGTSPSNTDVIKAFMTRCPAVQVTAGRDKADYIVRFDHDELSPTTLFVHGNKVAIFNREEDLVYSGSACLLGNAVKDACTAIARDLRR